MLEFNGKVEWLTLRHDGRLFITVVEPFALTPELIKLVTAIDGAILDGTCHAIGVILDGLEPPARVRLARTWKRSAARSRRPARTCCKACRCARVSSGRPSYNRM